MPVYYRVETQREREREREEKKRCWVHDSCKPQGYTSPRLAPPLATLVAPFLFPPRLPLSVSFLRCHSISLRVRPSIESPDRVVYRGLREERRGAREEIRGGSWGKRWLRHKPAIPARMTGDYVIRRDVHVLVCAGSRARSFVCSFVPRVFHVTPDSRMNHGLPALIHPIKFNFKRPARRFTLPAHSSPASGKIDPLNETD